MARGDTRGIPVAVAILLGVVAISGTVGVYVGNQGGNPTLWFVTSGVFLALAVLVYAVAYWILPHFKGDRRSGQPPSITVDNSPNTTIEANAPRDSFGEVEVKDSPGTDIQFKDSEETDEEA